MHYENLIKNIYIALHFKCLLVLDFLSLETSHQTTCLKESEKFHLKYYLIYVSCKSEFLFAIGPKFVMNS